MTVPFNEFHGRVTSRNRSVNYGVAADELRNILLIDQDQSHAAVLGEYLRKQGLDVDIVSNVRDGVARLRQISIRYEIVIINVSDPTKPWVSLVHELGEVAYGSGYGVGPRVLCTLSTKRESLFEFQIEQVGARLVYER